VAWGTEEIPVARLELIWNSSDAARLLGGLAEKYGLAMLVFEADVPRVFHPPFAEQAITNRSPLFLPSVEDVAVAKVTQEFEITKDWNWLTMTGGESYDLPYPLLELSVLSGGPRGALQWVRNRVLEEGASKVNIVNHFAKTQTLAKGVFPTTSAVSMWRAGVRWVQSRGDLHVEYLPVLNRGI
jgi:hypothetical protein